MLNPKAKLNPKLSNKYDPENSQYIFNLLLDLEIGTWRLRSELDDGKSYTVDISLRE